MEDPTGPKDFMLGHRRPHHMQQAAIKHVRVRMVLKGPAADAFCNKILESVKLNSGSPFVRTRSKPCVDKCSEYASIVLSSIHTGCACVDLSVQCEPPPGFSDAPQLSPGPRPPPPYAI